MKKLIIAVALLASAIGAKADYLYWMVDLTEQTAETEFAYASVSVGDVMLLNIPASGGATADLVSADSTGYATPKVYADVSDYHNATFIFELFRDDASFSSVGTKSVTYAELLQYGHIYSDPKTGATAYVVASVVPEPTSGLLLLLGFAGLALKRKRA